MWISSLAAVLPWLPAHPIDGFYAQVELDRFSRPVGLWIERGSVEVEPAWSEATRGSVSLRADRMVIELPDRDPLELRYRIDERGLWLGSIETTTFDWVGPTGVFPDPLQDLEGAWTAADAPPTRIDAHGQLHGWVERSGPHLQPWSGLAGGEPVRQLPYGLHAPMSHYDLPGQLTWFGTRDDQLFVAHRPAVCYAMPGQELPPLQVALLHRDTAGP